MSIVFESPAPIGLMQQAANAKVAYDTSKEERDFAFKQEVAQAGINHQQQQIAMQARAQAQGAYEFNASRQPSGRDIFAAQQHQQAQQAGFEHQEAMQERQLTRSEEIRMSRLQKQMDYLQEQKANNSIPDDAYQEGMAQLHGVLGPLELRLRRSQAQANEMRVQQQMEEQARIATIRRTNGESNTINRNGRDYQVDPNGMMQLMPGDEAQIAAERRTYGGASVADIRRSVRDRIRTSMAPERQGVAALSNDDVESLVGRDNFQDQVDQELQTRAMASSPQQEALLQHGLQLSSRIHGDMRREEAAAMAPAADPSLRQAWMGDETKRAAQHALRLQQELQGARAVRGLVDTNAPQQTGTPSSAPPATEGALPPLTRGHFPPGPQGDAGYAAATANRLAATATPTANARPGGETEANALEAIRGRVSEYNNSRPWNERIGALSTSGSTIDIRRMHEILQRAVGANADLTPQERTAYQQIYQRVADGGNVPAETLERMRLPGAQPRVAVEKDRVNELRTIAAEFSRGPGAGGDARPAVLGLLSILNRASQANRGLMPWEVSEYNSMLARMNRRREEGFGRIHDRLRLVRE